MGLSSPSVDIGDYFHLILDRDLGDESGECGVCGGVCGGELSYISKVSSFRVEIIEFRVEILEHRL